MIWFLTVYLFMMINGGMPVSYNLILLCHNATWDENAITFADHSVIGWSPHGIFITDDHHIYVAVHDNNKILVWQEGEAKAFRTLTVQLYIYTTLFVTSNGDVYFENGNQAGQIDKWSQHSNSSVFVTNFSGHCFGLFIDMNNDLYCSIRDEHRVVKTSLDSAHSVKITVAGTGCLGSAQRELSAPWGIFVDKLLNLYVADAGNNRIQVFRNSQSCGRTLAGRGIPRCLHLSYPTDVVVDGNGYLYIADNGNHRVIRSAGDDYQCIAGCSFAKLNKTYGIRLNSRGDLYVLDEFNHRIQKFHLINNGSVQSTNNPTTATCPSPEHGQYPLLSAISHLCNSSDTQCDILYNTFDIFQSCKNGGTCSENSQLSHKYTCACLPGFSGTSCEIDDRPTQSYLPPDKVSYNLPLLCPNATWNENATTFANQSVIGSAPHGIFIADNNHIYVADHTNNRILVWQGGEANPSRTLNVTLFGYTTLFVTSNGDVYFENGNQPGQIDKWPQRSNHNVFVTKFSGHCFGLFVDMNNDLYCSMRYEHRVVKSSLDSTESAKITVAGIGCPGGGQHDLSLPWGIFVDKQLNLYVADSGNSRIQMFRSGQLNGTTVVGQQSQNDVNLRLPTDVVVDGNGYLYIADNQHDRILRVRDGVHECVAGCTGKEGSAANQLKRAYSVRLNGCGHLYVLDEFNHRIQRFPLINGGCDVPPSDFFIAPICNSDGHQLDIMHDYCGIVKPCKDGEICHNNEDNSQSYAYTCTGRSNDSCNETDGPTCQLQPCWNKGIRNSTTNCQRACCCEPGWEGDLCERRKNDCQPFTCKNGGVCRSSFPNYTCECLSDDYSGPHCEIVSTKIIIYQFVAKSFAYVAILAMIAVAMFIVIMDILKYCFGIDPVGKDREAIRRMKQAKKRQPVIQRFIYIPGPVVPRPPKTSNPIIVETVA